MGRIPLVATALTSLSLASCEYAFSRTENVQPGDITGTAVRADKGEEPAPFAQVAVQGGSIIRRTDAAGAFVVRGLVEGPWVLRFSDDDDGDSNAERTAFSAARILPAAASTSSDRGSALNSVLLGTVALDGTFDVNGAVDVVDPALPGGVGPPDGSKLLARVVVTRDICVPLNPTSYSLECGAELADRISVGVEAEVSVDDTGAFAARGLGSGAVYAYALLFSQTQDALGLGQLVAISPPTEVRGIAGDVIATVLRVDPVQNAAVPVPVRIGLTPAPQGDMALIFALPGSGATCDGVLPAGAVVVAAEGADIVEVTAPPGIVDVLACGDAGGVRVDGVLSAALIVPPIDDADPPLLGPILMSADDPCGVPRDCDGDGRTGLPPLVEGSGRFAEDNALWSSCGDACGEAFGAGAGDSTCEASAGAGASAGTYDCDDDGDGQPDVTEAPACYGLGLGTDLDGDGLCSGFDPFPLCAANSAALCRAGEEQTRPAVRDLFGDICAARSPIAPPACAVWSVQDDDGDGVIEHLEGVAIDDAGRTFGILNVDQGAVSFEDQNLLRPDGTFAWTFNVVAQFPEMEIVDTWDAAGRLVDEVIVHDEDGSFDRVAERVTFTTFDVGQLDLAGRAAVTSLWEDQDANCTPDRVSYFERDEDGVMRALRVDGDGDGVVDSEVFRESDGGCNGGTPCSETFTSVDAAGAPLAAGGSERVVREGDGRIVRGEQDADGDGLFEHAATFDPERTEQRARHLGEPLLLTVEFDQDGDGQRERTRAFRYDDDGAVVGQFVDADTDLDGLVNTRLDLGFAPDSGALVRIAFGSDFSDPLDGIIDFRDVTTYELVLAGTPPLAVPVEQGHADDDSDNFTFVLPRARADGCAITNETACTAAGDCGGDACALFAPVAAPAGAAMEFASDFALATFCAPRAGAVDGGACTGTLINNGECAGGVCDDIESGHCTSVCAVDADCENAGDVCVGDILGGGRGTLRGTCATPCVSQLACGGGGRSCVRTERVEDGAQAFVCDGDRGGSALGGTFPDIQPTDCTTHMLLDVTNVCTELCISGSECSISSACVNRDVRTPDGVFLALPVCEPF